MDRIELKMKKYFPEFTMTKNPNKEDLIENLQNNPCNMLGVQLWKTEKLRNVELVKANK